MAATERAVGERPASPLESFRADAAAWLAVHAPPPGTIDVPARHDEQRLVAASRAWQSALAAGGWAGLSWPRRFGGRELSADHVRVFMEECARYPVTTVALGVGVEMVAPALMVHGSPEQQATYLERIRCGDHLWCQLFSEPGAGSDLAGLGTSARSEGDTWVIDGQKVWTTRAHLADLGLLLARTGDPASRHAGITAFVVDMASPGIEVRPIRQMDGGAEFNEVFFTGVRLPGDAVIGAVGGGWAVAMTMLGSERAYIGTALPDDELEQLLTAARRRGCTPLERRLLVDVVIGRRLIGYLGDRLLAAQALGRATGPIASVLKLAVCGQSVMLAELAMSIGGPGAVAALPGDAAADLAQRLLMMQWPVRIGGGTEQIQRSIIGERVLGLPR